MTWCQTYTGRRFDLFEPRVADICIEDIAHALAMQCRFNGHSCTFYSVAEHAVRVSWAVPPEDMLWGLLHDAAEAYLGDVIRPLKRELPVFQAWEDRVQYAISLCFGLTWPAPSTIKYADNRLLVTERRDLMAPPPEDWGIGAMPLEDIIEPWSWELAKENFLGRFHVLTNGITTPLPQGGEHGDEQSGCNQ